MKKLFNILLIAVIVGFSSCDDYLSVDKYLGDMLHQDTIFVRKDYTEQWLWNTYSYMNNKGAEITNKGQSAFIFASDDVFTCDWTMMISKYQNCEYSASQQQNEDRWGWLYEGIRKASQFIYNVDRCRELTSNEREDLRAQARFLRAYYYWMLIKQYGPVPLMPEQGMDISLPYNELALARNTYDECVDYISSEFAKAAQVLPATRPPAWLGQATRGAALAARAKVLLYAASPLYNGNTQLSGLKDDQGRVLISQEYSEEKWAKAAAAAKEVIDLGVYELLTIPPTSSTSPLPKGVPTAAYPFGCGNVDPFESYRQCFNGATTASNNPELILTRQRYSGYDILDIVKHAVPKADLGGWNTVCVSQKQADAYLMCDGKSITSPSTDYPYQYPNKGFTTSASEYPHMPAQVNLMYANREPRFYASVAFNGSVWENLSTTESGKKNLQEFYYKGSNNGKTLSEPDFYIRTGLGLKKYYNPDDSWNTGGSRIYRVEPTIRYADVLLWYAEALNELTSGKTYNITNYGEFGTIEVKREVGSIEDASKTGLRYAFSRVRFRAGLPDLTDAVYNDPNQFRTALKRERQVELFAEACRYFDLRRWKDAPEEEAKPVMGCNVDMMNTDEQRGAFYYPPKAADIPKVWLAKMYLWPLPTGELKRNAKLTQNPGW